MPQTILLDGSALHGAKTRLANGDQSLQPAFEALCKDADTAMSIAPASVMDKAVTPSSGDKHDFMSMGPYWWPDPDKPDGLPYIRRDGVSNPQSAGDRDAMYKMASGVETLATAYYFGGNEAYAQHAALLLRTWFVDPATRMNPNLRFAQAIPGRTEGRSIGIIDTLRLVVVVDAVRLLEASPYWSANDRQEMTRWFSEYLDWLVTHPNAIQERAAKNNHGTNYDVQVSVYALFVGKPELAKKTLQQVPTRIDSQIQPDGSLPEELLRTKSLHYCTFNTTMMMKLAILGQRNGVDLAGYVGPQGQSIRKAVDWLAARYTRQQPWTTEQIVPYNIDESVTLLRLASLTWNDGNYEQMIWQLPGEPIANTKPFTQETLRASRVNLTWPARPLSTPKPQ